MAGTYTPLNEWCDENQHRQFPLTDASSGRDLTGSFNLPQTFMCDMLLAVPSGADLAMFFIESVLVRKSSIDVYVAYEKADASIIVVGSFTGIPIPADRNSVYYLEPAAQALEEDSAFSIMTGALVVGATTEIKERPGLWAFERTAANIIQTRLTIGLAAVHSIAVGSSVFTGDIRLREGDNITITPSYDAVTDITTLTIAADIGTIEDIDIPLTSDASIIEALTRRFGRPVETINGIQPNSDGNFQLIEEDCTEITGVPGGFGVTIENPCSLPCCDKTHLENIYYDISELNVRFARLESYYENLSRNINEMQALMLGFEL